MRIGDVHTIAMSTHSSMLSHSDALSDSLERLSGGLRINRAADDASSMTIANQLSSQAFEDIQRIKNKNDEIGMLQITDGAMEEQTRILDTVRVKLIQRANATQTTESQNAIDGDISRLLESYSNISDTTQYNGTKLLDGEFEYKNGLKVEKVEITAGTTTLTSEAIAALSGDSGVYNTSDLMNVAEARSKYDLNGAGYGVVVIDTGIDTAHPFFDGRVVYTEDVSDADADALASQDVHGHGTHVASIIGSSDATYGGVAPSVDLIGIKALNDDGTGTGTAAALQWVIDNADTYNITAVNMSLGGSTNSNVPETGYDTLLKQITDMGIINVAAAGNDYAANDPDQGASHPGNSIYTIGVGSVHDDDMISDFSQRSTEVVDIFAVGSDVLAADSDGINDGTIETNKSGTSMASPQVAGIVVLIQEYAEREFDRTLTLEEMRDLIVNTAVSIHDGDDEAGPSTSTGEDFWRIDALGAIDALASIKTASFEYVDIALKKIRENRSNIGATQNMLQSEIAYRSVQNIAHQSAASQLRDADFAKESQKLSKSMILSQSSSYALTQVLNRYDAIAELLA